jgi:hypothetical protein
MVSGKTTRFDTSYSIHLETLNDKNTLIIPSIIFKPTKPKANADLLIKIQE